MKKLALFFVLYCVVSSMAYNNPKKEVRKTHEVFTELTKVMLLSKPVETIKHQDRVVPYWKIEKGGFYYLRSEQKFYGKYKSCNFTSTSEVITVSGVEDEKERLVKKELLSDLMSDQY